MKLPSDLHVLNLALINALDKSYEASNQFQFPPPKHTVPLVVLVPITPPPLRDDDIQLLPTCGVQEGPQTPPVTTTTTSVLKPPKKAYLGISHFSSELLVTLQAALHLTDTDLQLAGKSSANA
ncbi:hypothetical protein Pelo_18969 [Pelomyxa schiedti]|nr:hypothetical protein Pelo_18969 [Pelomyxa schiedti]